MSLATRCPHCNTIFKVVQDQLKVSEGWVRCGRCTEVFNALEGLFDMEREAPPQRVVPPPAPSVAPPPAQTPMQAAPADETRFYQPPTDRTPAFQATEPAAFAPDADDAAVVTDDMPPPDPRPTPAVTHFELDLPPSDEAVAAAMSALTQPAIRTAADDDFESAPASYPVTDEADALDSRYLLPSDEMRRPPNRRRPRRGGPEFADAQFPMDAMADLDDDWDAGWTHPGESAETLSESERLAEAALSAAVNPPEAAAPTAPLQATAIPPEALKAPSAEPLSNARAEPANTPEADHGPSTIPSRLPDDASYQPEQSLPPPSKRKGRPGTRGRGPQTEAPGFIKQAERKAIWRHPAVRAVLSLVALALALLLGAQFVQQEHDRIASRHPDLTPYLAQWCHFTGCTLSPPMQIEDLQVDNIALVKTSSLGEDTYRLTAIIHNRAEAVLAWPHLDLSLTDANGTVVVRRVFDVQSASRVGTEGSNAADDGSSEVPAAVPASSSTTLQWRLRAPDLAPAGYTVELFYP
ncbi:MAG TPA: zinc-ribbon domain-containing protein [Candidatus Aquabacterium excrementipullorum]|nr:zinc-ribbon domain-containing protein [Candidatus Aquabacterium excrementipullorum]